MQWFFWAFSSRFHQGKQQRCHFSTNIPGATRLWPWRWHPTVKASQKFLPPQKGHIPRRKNMGPKSLDINNPFRKASKVPFLPSTPGGFQRPENLEGRKSTGKSTKLRIFQNDKMRNGEIWGLFKGLFWEDPTEASWKFHRICLLFPYHSLFAGHANLMV